MVLILCSVDNQVTFTSWDVDITETNDNIYGLRGDDTLRGGGGDDNLSGGEGEDILLGDGGFNTAIFNDIMSQYKIIYEDNGDIKVEHINGGLDGIDTLSDIQRLQFADANYNIDDITNSFDKSSGVNSELGKINRGKIDYNKSNNFWSNDFDVDNFSLELVKGSKIEVVKSIYPGSPAESRVRLRGIVDTEMWQSDISTFDVDITGIDNFDVYGTEGADFGITIKTFSLLTTTKSLTPTRETNFPGAKIILPSASLQ